jgi:hypothetical protein
VAGCFGFDYCKSDMELYFFFSFCVGHGVLLYLVFSFAPVSDIEFYSVSYFCLPSWRARTKRNRNKLHTNMKGTAANE